MQRAEDPVYSAFFKKLFPSRLPSRFSGFISTSIIPLNYANPLLPETFARARSIAGRGQALLQPSLRRR